MAAQDAGLECIYFVADHLQTEQAAHRKGHLQLGPPLLQRLAALRYHCAAVLDRVAPADELEEHQHVGQFSYVAGHGHADHLEIQLLDEQPGPDQVHRSRNHRHVGLQVVDALRV